MLLCACTPFLPTLTCPVPRTQAETTNSNSVEDIGEVAEGNGGIGGGRRSKGGRGAPRRVFNLHLFVETRTPKEERELKRRQSRPGSKWVAFGSTPPRAHGCKESYSYVSGGSAGDFGSGKSRRDGTSGEQAPTAMGLMSYARFGECPSWYGVGRTCSVDLQARRIDSFAALPSRLRQKVLEIDPEFGAGPPSTLEECRAVAARERRARDERRGRARRSLRRPLGIRGSDDE